MLCLHRYIVEYHGKMLNWRQRTSCTCDEEELFLSSTARSKNKGIILSYSTENINEINDRKLYKPSRNAIVFTSLFYQPLVL